MNPRLKEGRDRLDRVRGGEGVCSLAGGEAEHGEGHPWPYGALRLLDEKWRSSSHPQETDFWPQPEAWKQITRLAQDKTRQDKADT